MTITKKTNPKTKQNKKNQPNKLTKKQNKKQTNKKTKNKPNPEIFKMLKDTDRKCPLYINQLQISCEETGRLVIGIGLLRSLLLRCVQSTSVLHICGLVPNKTRLSKYL